MWYKRLYSFILIERKSIFDQRIFLSIKVLNEIYSMNGLYYQNEVQNTRTTLFCLKNWTTDKSHPKYKSQHLKYSLFIRCTKYVVQFFYTQIHLLASYLIVEGVNTLKLGGWSTKCLKQYPNPSVVATNTTKIMVP